MRALTAGLEPYSALSAFCLDGFFAAGLEDSSALSLGSSAPDSVIDSIFERVLETTFLDRALCADAFSNLDTDAVAREEGLGWLRRAKASGHPCQFHMKYLQVFTTVLRTEWAESSRKERLLTYSSKSLDREMAQFHR